MEFWANNGILIMGQLFVVELLMYLANQMHIANLRTKAGIMSMVVDKVSAIGTKVDNFPTMDYAKAADE
eukprot:10174209-Heterocapsa_arctica.AAC.1